MQEWAFAPYLAWAKHSVLLRALTSWSRDHSSRPEVGDAWVSGVIPDATGNAVAPIAETGNAAALIAEILAPIDRK